MLGREHAMGHPALTDENTGLANRLHFELVYSYLFNGADRGVPLTLMLVSAPAPDDDTLRALGKRIRATTRTSDLVAHLGGGRFIVILLGTNLSGGRIAADRTEMALQGVAVGPVAIGLATYHAEMKESSDLLKAVDDALQKAEAAGGGVEL
jgi:GGDEF domain-containing protein